MAGNSFGKLFRLTTFGESHGKAIGGIVDGCPAGLQLDEEFVQSEMTRRRPGQSEYTTARNEDDRVQWLSGFMNGVTTGAPVAFFVANRDQKSADYDALKDIYRPGHADFTYQQKYGLRDHRGSGRASARETACRVVGGALAKQLLWQVGVDIQAFVSSVHDIHVAAHYTAFDLSATERSPVRCPDEATAQRMMQAIAHAKAEGDSLGGCITCVCKGVPAGWGEPVFDKLNAQLGHAMLSINAVKGFEMGDGFSAALRKGSTNNDGFGQGSTNHDGGVQGGISNGKDVWFRVAFKPVSTIAKEQATMDVHGNETTLSAKGRHDPCVLPRAVVIVEAMTALVLADFLMLSRSDRINSTIS
jgi:chorismate synthase